jgi:hypothetical protein
MLYRRYSKEKNGGNEKLNVRSENVKLTKTAKKKNIENNGFFVRAFHFGVTQVRSRETDIPDAVSTAFEITKD